MTYAAVRGFAEIVRRLLNAGGDVITPRWSDVPIRSGADRKKWSSRVLTTATMLLGRVARGLSWSCQTWAAPGTTGRSARSRRSCPVRRGTRWRRRGGVGRTATARGLVEFEVRRETGTASITSRAEATPSASQTR